MNKVIIFLTIIFISILAISSCKKEEDKNWSKSLLIGTWEQVSGTDFIECPSGDNAKIVISDNDYTEYSTDVNGCVTDFGLSSNYSFDGKEIVLVNATTYKVTQLDENNLAFEVFFEGYKVGVASYSKQ